MKSKKVTLLLSFFLGNFGIHRFYVGKIGTGILWLFTLGLFGIGNLIDFIRICVGEFKDKHGNPLRDDCSKTLIVVLVAIWAFLFVIGFISGFVSSVNSSSNTTNDYQNTYTEQYENNVVNDSVEKTHSNDYIENEVKKEETKVPTVVEYDRVMKVPGFFEQLRYNTRNYKRGISNEQVCIVVAVDDDRKIIAKPVSVGRLDSVDARNLLSKHLGKGAILVTDSHASYPVVAQDADVRHVQIESGKHSNGRFNLGDINGVHSEIEKFMPETAERIPATKYLNQYMAFFTWLWLHKGLSLDEKVILLRRTVNNEITDYNETYDSLRNRPLDINTKGEFPQVV